MQLLDSLPTSQALIPGFRTAFFPGSIIKHGNLFGYLGFLWTQNLILTSVDDGEVLPSYFLYVYLVPSEFYHQGKMVTDVDCPRFSHCSLPSAVVIQHLNSFPRPTLHRTKRETSSHPAHTPNSVPGF